LISPDRLIPCPANRANPTPAPAISSASAAAPRSAGAIHSRSSHARGTSAPPRTCSPAAGTDQRPHQPASSTLLSCAAPRGAFARHHRAPALIRAPIASPHFDQPAQHYQHARGTAVPLECYGDPSELSRAAPSLARDPRSQEVERGVGHVLPDYDTAAAPPHRRQKFAVPPVSVLD
jgi:hypothetical protein